MPLGVEHDNQERLNNLVTCLFSPLMPLGVEHLLPLRIVADLKRLFSPLMPLGAERIFPHIQYCLLHFLLSSPLSVEHLNEISYYMCDRAFTLPLKLLLIPSICEMLYSSYCKIHFSVEYTQNYRQEQRQGEASWC